MSKFFFFFFASSVSARDTTVIGENYAKRERENVWWIGSSKRNEFRMQRSTVIERNLTESWWYSFADRKILKTKSVQFVCTLFLRYTIRGTSYRRTSIVARKRGRTFLRVSRIRAIIGVTNFMSRYPPCTVYPHYLRSVLNFSCNLLSSKISLFVERPYVSLGIAMQWTRFSPIEVLP